MSESFTQSDASSQENKAGTPVTGWTGRLLEDPSFMRASSTPNEGSPYVQPMTIDGVNQRLSTIASVSAQVGALGSAWQAMDNSQAGQGGLPNLTQMLNGRDGGSGAGGADKGQPVAGGGGGSTDAATAPTQTDGGVATATAPTDAGLTSGTSRSPGTSGGSSDVSYHDRQFEGGGIVKPDYRAGGVPVEMDNWFNYYMALWGFISMDDYRKSLKPVNDQQAAEMAKQAKANGDDPGDQTASDQSQPQPQQVADNGQQSATSDQPSTPTTYQPQQRQQVERPPVKQASFQPSTSFDPATEANRIFLTQYQSSWNPDGPSGSSNCGPASLAMAFKLFGKIPSSADTEGSIEQVRYAMTSRDNINEATTFDQLRRGAAAGGLDTQVLSGLQGVNAAVDKGVPVIAAGNPDMPGAYAQRLNASEYNNFNGRHLILVLGKDKNNGNYIINDPLSRVGGMEVTPRELAAYLSDKTQPSGNVLALWPKSTSNLQTA